MTESFPTAWWIVAGVLVVAELLTGTLYLLLLAIGAAAGGLALLSGFSVPLQITAAALVGGGTTAWWHFRRAHHPRSAPAQSNPDVLLDIGQLVQVTHWEADGSTRVQHRGSAWQARRVASGATFEAPMPGAYRITAIEGNILQLSPAGD